jgi:hypothetical protein
MVEATILVSGDGSFEVASVSTTHRAAANQIIRRGRRIPARRTVPPLSATMTEIGLFILNVWIERVRSITGPSPRGPIPKYRSLRLPRIRTVSIDQPSARRSTSRYLRPGDCRLRYIMSTGTLARLWQRQNDANSELAAPRRTTAANRTLAAGSATSRLPQSYDFVPSSCYTMRAPELREACYLLPGSPRARPPAGRPVAQRCDTSTLNPDSERLSLGGRWWGAKGRTERRANRPEMSLNREIRHP